MGVVTAITGVWTSMMTWITDSFPAIQNIFFNAEAGTLTFMGVLASAALGISVFFLLMGVIQNFLHLRG